MGLIDLCLLPQVKQIEAVLSQARASFCIFVTELSPQPTSIHLIHDLQVKRKVYMMSVEPLFPLQKAYTAPYRRMGSIQQEFFEVRA